VGGGIVASVRGTVVDIDFTGSVLPPIDSALIVALNRAETPEIRIRDHALRIRRRDAPISGTANR
jgi:F0F1-type ATP synthase beta subunit